MVNARVINLLFRENLRQRLWLFIRISVVPAECKKGLFLWTLWRSERSEDASKLSRFVHFEKMCCEIPAGAICFTEMVRILLMKFHYDSLASSILRIVVPGTTVARTAFPSFAIYAHRLKRARTAANENDKLVISQFSRLGFTDARSARFSHCPQWYPRRESNTPTFGPFCITANRPCWTGLDFAYWLSRRDCGNERVARKSDDEEGRCHVGGGGGKRSRVKSAVLMLSILVLSIMRTGSAG